MSKKIGPGPIPHISSSTDIFWSTAASNTSSPFDCFLLNTYSKFQQNDRSKLGFVDIEKVEGISNSDLPLIIAVVIIDLIVTRFLVDDMSYFNTLYKETLELVSLYRTNLSPSKGDDLLDFNNLITHPCGVIDLTLLVGEETRHRTVSLPFLVIW